MYGFQSEAFAKAVAEASNLRERNQPSGGTTTCFAEIYGWRVCDGTPEPIYGVRQIRTYPGSSQPERYDMEPGFMWVERGSILWRAAERLHDARDVVARAHADAVESAREDKCDCDEDYFCLSHTVLRAEEDLEVVEQLTRECK